MIEAEAKRVIETTRQEWDLEVENGSAIDTCVIVGASCLRGASAARQHAS
jgi:hypothetical protein